MNPQFGQHIVTARLAKNFNKSELARRLGITPSYVTDIEAGKVPSEEIIERIVSVLDLDEKETFMLADKIPVRIYEEAKRTYFGSLEGG